ncbi:MAG: tape measure protein [Acidimicrobiia bacterium]|nr:tape measure protein [Acidimicrobiia bacterium]
MKLIVVGGTTFTLFARSVAQAGNQVNKFINTLVILKGNTTDASIELQALFNLSQKLGTSFTAAAQPFTKFAAAAAGALGDQAIRDVFESFATVGVALQLSQSEVTGVFLALQQIASKGVVSMEELRLQLAERVPGAMRLAASSMNMTMQDFEKAVTARTLNAGEFLENFAAKLKEVYGDAAALASTRLFADIQRLGNVILKFRQEVFASGFERGLQTLVRSAINFLDNNPELAQALGRFSEGIFEQVANFLDKLTPDRVINFLNTLISVFESLVNALNIVVFQIRKLFDDEFNAIIDNVSGKTRELEGLLVDRDRLTRIAGGQIATNFASREEDIIWGPANERQIENAKQQLEGMDERILILRGSLAEARMEARDLGVALGDLPGDPFARFDEGSGSIGPGRVEFPRIEPLSPEARAGQRDQLPLGNQPDLDFGTTATIQDALEQAERLSTMEMPEFYDKLISGELRQAMSDLERVTLDLNVANDSQNLLLQEIKSKEEELNALRSVGDSMSNEQAAELNQLRMKLIELTEKYLEQEEARIKLKEEQLKLMDQEERRLAQFKTFQEELEEQMTSTRDVFMNIIKKTEDAITDFVMTGKMNFKDLADGIIRELVRMAVQAFITRFILGPLLGPMSGNVGGGLGGPFATPGGGGGNPPPPAHTGGVFHDGGIVEPKPSAFEMLKNNERMIIVQTGEGVFTRDQMANMASLSDVARVANRSLSPVSVMAPNVNVTQSPTKVEVINNNPGQAEPEIETQTQADGSELIRVVLNAVTDDITKDGQIARVMKGKYGLRNRTNLR